MERLEEVDEISEWNLVHITFSVYFFFLSLLDIFILPNCYYRVRGAVPRGATSHDAYDICIFKSKLRKIIVLQVFC